MVALEQLLAVAGRADAEERSLMIAKPRPDDLEIEPCEDYEFSNSQIRVDLTGNDVIDLSAIWSEFEPGTWWPIEELRAGYLP